MTCAVVTFSSGREWLPSITNPVKADYCQRHGYDFVFKSMPQHPERPPSWEKLDAVEECLRDHDVVMWMDDDAVPSNFGIRFEKIIPTWCYMALARDYLWLNVGVFIMRRKPEAFALLEKWKGMYEAFKDACLWEQDAFQSLYAENSLGIWVCASESLNSFEGEFRPQDRDLFRPWQSGDFAYHFSGQGEHTKQKREFLEAKVDQIVRENEGTKGKQA